MSKPNGGPAFPWSGVGEHNHGMTLRDYFAAAALQGLVQRNEVVPRYCGEWNPEQAKELCADAYALADGMLAERAK